MNREDLDPLLDEALRAACYLLEKNGEFFPFGVVLMGTGERRHIQGWTADEQPRSADVIGLLLQGFRSGASSGEYRATALVKDVRVKDSDHAVVRDAVCVTLEHEDGTAINCYLPYEQRNGQYSYGKIFADPAEGEVFLAK